MRSNVTQAVQSLIVKRSGTRLEEGETDLVTRSIYYVVANRCGIELADDKPTFDDITAAYMRWRKKGECRMSIALTYSEGQAGMLYPNIIMEKENLSKLGKYGMMAMDYLKENHYQRYRSLKRFGRLTEVLSPVNEEAYRMIDMMMENYLKSHKPENPADTMEMWKIRQQGMMQAEEIVIAEVVNKYH